MTSRVWIGVSLLAVLAVLGFGAVLFVRAASPADLVELRSACVAPDGRWTAVSGRCRFRGSYEPLFFMRSESHFHRAGSSARIADAPVFSADGQYSAWCVRSGEGWEIAWIALDEDADVRRLSHRFSTAPALAIDRDSIAAVDAEDLVVFDRQRGLVVASVPLPPRQKSPMVYFAATGAVRLYPRQRGARDATSLRHEMFEFDRTSGQLTRTGEVASSSPGLFIRPDPMGVNALSLEKNRTIVTLRDARTGTERAKLDLGGEKLRGAMFLPRGGVVVASRAGAHTALRRFAEDGTRRWTSEIPIASGGVAFAGVIAERHVVVSVTASNLSGDAKHPPVWQLWLIDIDTGAARLLRRRVAPLDPLEFWIAPFLSMRHYDASVGVPFLDDQRRVVFVDPHSE